MDSHNNQCVRNAYCQRKPGHQGSCAVSKTAAEKIDKLFETVFPPKAELYDYYGCTPLANRCEAAPEGWWCAREKGHDGPCAAYPNPEGEDALYIPERKNPCLEINVDTEARCMRPKGHDGPHCKKPLQEEDPTVQQSDPHEQSRRNCAVGCRFFGMDVIHYVCEPARTGDIIARQEGRDVGQIELSKEELQQLYRQPKSEELQELRQALRDAHVKLEGVKGDLKRVSLAVSRLFP